MLPALVEPRGVEVRGVRAEHTGEVALAEDQDVVGCVGRKGHPCAGERSAPRPAGRAELRADDRRSA